jgi:hypothetical protein
MPVPAPAIVLLLLCALFRASAAVASTPYHRAGDRRRLEKKALPVFSTVQYSSPAATGLGHVAAAQTPPPPLPPPPAPPPAPPPPVTPLSPPQKVVDSAVVILILSARSSVTRRKAIRSSWATGSSNVFFIVGEKACEIPQDWRKPWTCDLRDGVDPSTDPAGMAAHKAETEAEQKRLLDEAKAHPDLILVPMVDAYRSLPRKLKEAYRWGLQAAPKAKWFVKG